MKYNLEDKACEICGTKDRTLIWSKTRRKIDGKLRSVVIQDGEAIIHGNNYICNTCGLVYINTRMDKQSLDKFYKEEYRKIYELKGNAETIHSNTAMVLLSTLGLKPQYKILDVGAGSGKLVDSLRSVGLNAIGIDADTTIEKSKHIENITIEDYNPESTFDVITLLNSLEHFYSPNEVLTKVRTILNDNGLIMVNVPNLLGMTFTRTPDAFLSNAHLFNFCPRTLELLLSKNGFEVLGVHKEIEGMGEKLYMLAKKCNTDFNIKFDSNINAEAMKEYLELWDKLIDVRREIGI